MRSLGSLNTGGIRRKGEETFSDHEGRTFAHIKRLLVLKGGRGAE